MTRRTILVAVFTAVFAVSSVALAQTAPRPGLDKLLAAAKPAVTEVTVAQAVQMGKMFPNMVWLDVRQDAEWSTGHIPGAKFISRGLLEFRVESSIPDKNTKILVYCQSGGRGALATKTLVDMGYKDVRNMAGGFTGWQEVGQPVEK